MEKLNKFKDIDKKNKKKTRKTSKIKIYYI